MTDSEYEYNSLREIRTRKLKLKGELTAQEKSIKHLWDNIFHKPENATLMTPSKRMSQFISTGSGIFDGIVLGLKLYNRFKGKK